MEEVGQQSRQQTVSDLAGRILKVAICVPSTDGFWNAKFGESLANLVAGYNLATGDKEIRVIAKCGPIMPEVRHRCIGEALHSEATHLLMLAPHLSFPADALTRLIERGKPAISVNYIQDVWTGTFSAYRTKGIQVRPDPTGPEVEEVDGTSIGMALFHTSIFDSIELPFFMNEQIGDSPGFTFDYVYFWKKLADAGIKCNIDHELSREIKNMEYGIRWH